MAKQYLKASVTLIALLISSISFGQTSEEARRELQKKKIPWNDEEFISRAKKGDIETLKLFLAAGTKPDVKDSDGRTALIWASSIALTSTANILLNSGADVNAADNKSISALMEASSAGRTEMVRLLLEKGANVNSAADDGRTSLMYASSEGHGIIIKILIENGGNINAVTKEGMTPLMIAASKGHLEAVKLLLDAGADIDAVDSGGFTALMWAEANERTSVVRLLKKIMGGEVYSAPSQTLTNPQLQRDVWNHILQLELASDEKCREHSIRTMQVLEYPSRIGVNIWAELWSVDRCGERVDYRIDFRPDDKGGAYFDVKESKDAMEGGKAPSEYKESKSAAPSETTPLLLRPQ